MNDGEQRDQGQGEQAEQGEAIVGQNAQDLAKASEHATSRSEQQPQETGESSAPPASDLSGTGAAGVPNETGANGAPSPEGEQGGE